MARLFVYGTLKPTARQRGGRPAHVWGRIWRDGCRVAVRLMEPGYGCTIAGLVFAVTPDELTAFDRRHGVESHSYRRVRARTVEGEEVWVYEGHECLRNADNPWHSVRPGESRVADWDAHPIPE